MYRVVCDVVGPELRIGQVDPRVRSGEVGSGHNFYNDRRVESGLVQFLQI